MKKFVVFVVAIAFFHAIAGIVANAPAAEKIPVRAGQVGTMKMTGEVVSVDSATRTVTITTKRGSMTFTVDDKTKIVIGKKGKSLEDLKPGDTLKVTYNEAAGKNVAQRITVSATGKRK
jgi:Cu/Ag efflux protein CusF